MCLLMESPSDFVGFDALFVFLSRLSICNGVPVNSNILYFVQMMV